MAGFTETSNAWTQAWLDMQKQYLDTWSRLAQQGVPGSAGLVAPFTAAANPWAGTFDQWSKLFAQGLPANVQDVSTRLFDLGKNYLDMSERFWHLLREGKDSTSAITDWQQALQQAFAGAGKGLAFPGGAADPWAGFANLWGLPLSNWQRMATSFSPFPGEMEKALRPEHIPQPSELTRTLRQYLSLPPVGYTRELQEQQQEWLRLFGDYLHTVQSFGGLLGKVVQHALELFGKRMTEKTHAGEAPEGLRAIYNLWIDCGEDAYAAQVATTEFPQLQADMVNALMRMKRHEQLMIEEVMTALNVPTRQELDTTHKRVYELQQQVCRLQDALDDITGSGNGSPAVAAGHSSAKAAGKTGRRAKTKTAKEE